MDWAVASATRLSAGDCRIVFRVPKLEERTDWSRNWSFWFVVAGICGGLSEKAGSADDHRSLRIHAEPALPWQRRSGGRGSVGDAFADIGQRPWCVLRGCLFHRDAERRRRIAGPLRRRV